jgi:DNA-binding NarL/FixJ family response regulator
VIRVLLADDQALVRAGFRVLVDSDPDLQVVGEATNGAEAVDLAARDHPDVVLMDIRMPVMDGLEATRRICANGALATTRVLILTTFEADDYVFEALRAGASGFLLKDTEPAELLDGVRVVARGDALLAPSVTRRLIAQVVSQTGRAQSADRSRLSVLTEREQEVLGQVAVGLTNEEIGVELYLSPLTVKTHVSRILSKLGARDRTQLVVIAYESGLVRPGGGAEPTG